MTTEKMLSLEKKYFCNICNYLTCKNSSFNNHILTLKHKKALLTTQMTTQICSHHNCINCSKTFNDRAGLWRHNKKYHCNNIIESNEKIQELSNEKPIEQQNITSIRMTYDVEKLTNMFIETVKQNQELQRQSQEFQKQIFEMMKDNIGSNNNNNINNINSNNKFNLNVFLNETCKDAMNLSDFIESIKVKFEDIEYSGENGFAAGVSRIFVQELNKLEICKRPIHCSDIKREIFHIKDQDSWEKERKLLVKVIQQITKKNVILLVDWRLAHPGCMEYRNIMNNKYDKINGECLGPYKDDEELRDYNRIIANVAKATMIDKKPLL